MIFTVDPDPREVAGALRECIGLLFRRLRHVKAQGDLTLPELAAMTRLDRGGPATPTALAKLEQISPQSMGATIAALEARGLLERRSDPIDRRQAVISLSTSGIDVLRNGRAARAAHMAQTLAERFTQDELRQLFAAAPLLERLAHHI